MHIWHHAKTLSKKHQFGVNFGLTLSIWDYIFKTNYISFYGKTVEIGFESDEHYPQTFFKQMTQGFQSKNKMEIVPATIENIIPIRLSVHTLSKCPKTSKID